MRILSRLTFVVLIAFCTASLGFALFGRSTPAASTSTSAPSAHPAALAGLWSLWPDAKNDGDKVRFYFFHPDGFGLYRYGKIGLNTTNSFDWAVDGEELVLTFRKTGEVRRTRFALDAHKSLTLLDDPREPLQRTARYAFVPPPDLGALAPDLDDSAATGKPGEVPGRLWIHAQPFKTGGMAFSLYQLKDAAIDGRGVGWHHIGDFDDWSTEALTYRYSAQKGGVDGELEMQFTVRNEHAVTGLRRTGSAGIPDLTLVEDPRNYWHVSAYKDAGPSFGAFVLARH